MGTSHRKMSTVLEMLYIYGSSFVYVSYLMSPSLLFCSIRMQQPVRLDSLCRQTLILMIEFCRCKDRQSSTPPTLFSHSRTLNLSSFFSGTFRLHSDHTGIGGFGLVRSDSVKWLIAYHEKLGLLGHPTLIHCLFYPAASLTFLGQRVTRNTSNLTYVTSFKSMCIIVHAKYTPLWSTPISSADLVDSSHLYWIQPDLIHSPTILRATATAEAIMSGAWKFKEGTGSACLLDREIAHILIEITVVWMSDRLFT